MTTARPWGRPPLGLLLVVAFAAGGGVLGAALAAPGPVEEPRVVVATVARGAPLASAATLAESPQREALIGLDRATVRANVQDYLAEVAAGIDTGAALAQYDLRGVDDACAVRAGDCPAGIGATVLAGEPPPISESKTNEQRPATLVSAPTSDLVVVSVAHRADESVRVYPNVLSGLEPRCDSVVTGFDLFAHPLGELTTTLASDFDRRTTLAFDINEGLTFFLCIEVTTNGATEPNYRAQAVVETADRLLPVVSVVSAAGPPLISWSLQGILPSGQHCGTWRSGSTLDSPVTLCDYVEVLGSEIALGATGRGLLPWSAGDPATFTAEVASGVAAPTYTALDLGAASRCTGVCEVPPDAFYAVGGPRASAVLRVNWRQGNVNGARVTTIGALTDSATPPPSGPELDIGTTRLEQNGIDAETRGISATLRFRSDRPSSYLARMLSGDGGAPCTRPGAVTEQRGELSGGDPWGEPVAMLFSGLCAGTDYRAVVELTAGGITTTWGPETAWGSRSLLHTGAFGVALDIDYELSSATYFEEYSARGTFTLRADGLTLADEVGGCFAAAPTITGTIALPALRLGEVTRLSGTLGEGDCGSEASARMPDATFAFDLRLDDLFAHPEGIVVRVQQAPPGTVVATLRISRLD